MGERSGGEGKRRREKKGRYSECGKKKVWWHSTFGAIEVEEPQLREGSRRLRPFAREAEIANRGCSLPLQRVLTDFGADIPFCQVPGKVKEHYGITIASSTIRRVTERHARVLHEEVELREAKFIAGSPAAIIAEMDGGMVPVVECHPEAVDKRKGKTLQWKEAKICLAHRHESADMAYGGTFSGGVDEAGRAFHQCAVAVGFDSGNPLHALGDGAQWIKDQIEEHFGAKGHYLVDFYHVCDYLAAAAKVCSPEPVVWMQQQKDALKSNQSSAVLAALLPHIEPAIVEDQDAPVRKAYRYLQNRRQQLDYKGAIEKKLPIGSGEIESAHRYLVQQRLKRPGAWWTPDNVDYMLALRLARANRRWDDYWKHVQGEKCAA